MSKDLTIAFSHGPRHRNDRSRRPYASKPVIIASSIESILAYQIEEKITLITIALLTIYFCFNITRNEHYAVIAVTLIKYN